MKSIRILAIALCCVLVFSFNVLADNFECPAYMWRGRNYNPSGYITIDYLYGDGSSEPSVNPTTGYHLGVVADCQFQNDTSYVFVFTINSTTSDIWYSDYYNILQLHSGEVERIYQESTNNYFDKASYYTSGFEDGNITYIVTFNTSGDELAYTYNKLYFAWVTKLTGTSSYDYSFSSISCYATYDPEGANLNDIQSSITNIINQSTTNTTNIINKLDEVIQNQNNSNNNIQESLDNIITNQETNNEYWQQIINYGSNYSQIDQTIINGLGSAEDQLSNAEDAIQNKSQSLVNKVASQWTVNKGVASSYLTTISPATSAIGTVTDNFFEAIPEEIKNAVITIMLIVFIGWLIGRVEG